MASITLKERVEFALNDLAEKRGTFSLDEVNKYLRPQNRMDFKEIFEMARPILKRMAVSWHGEAAPARIIVSAKNSGVNAPVAGRVHVARNRFPDFMEEHEWPAIIELFKEKGDIKWARILGGLLAEYVRRNRELKGADCIVPVPPGEGKSLELGYDPCLLLAKAVSMETGMPVEPCFLKAEKTDFCGLKDREIKEGQARTAFVLIGSESVRGKHVLLLDDVVNSGATIGALTAQLEKAGVRKADALVLSIGRAAG